MLLREEVQRSVENPCQIHFESLGKDLAYKETGIMKFSLLLTVVLPEM